MSICLLALAVFSYDVRGAFKTDRNAEFVLGGTDTIGTYMSTVPGSVTARITCISSRNILREFPSDEPTQMGIGPGNRFHANMTRDWLLWLWKATPNDPESEMWSYNAAPGRFTHHWLFSEIDSSRSWVRSIDSLRPRSDSSMRIPLVTALDSIRIDSIVPGAGTSRARLAILKDDGTPATLPLTLARGQNLTAEIASGGATPTELWRIHIDGEPRDSFVVGGLPVASVHREAVHATPMWKRFDALGRAGAKPFFASPMF